MRDLAALVGRDSAEHDEARACVEEICSLVVSLTECSAHAGYLLAVLQEGSSPETPGPVDRYQVCRAAADVAHGTALLRAHRLPTISSLQVTDICTGVTENASVLADCCLVAADEAPDDGTRQQFRLCLKSVTAAADAFCGSVESLRDRPGDRNYKACQQVFGEALATTCDALAVFATQDARLTGVAATLGAAGRDALRRVLGACLGVVSPSVLACQLAGRLPREPGAASRLRLCCEAVARGSGELVRALHASCDDRGDGAERRR
ncbi:talin rod domain-containing protein 1-like [Bacillus rossius redtenbacheri]|uniref:talin rod domain-containing protein 1-like n=1 Tax=Bacillus rossius redtenbacheri TaxID=93214 RepID=UPI002FDCC178